MRDEQEKKTMNERIQAFYRQSGGPNNAQIGRIIEQHLLNGKDHGVPGKRETFKDAIMEVFLDDYSTKDLVMWLLKTKYDISDRWEEFVGGKPSDPEVAATQMMDRIEQDKVAKLEERLASVEQKLEVISNFIQSVEKSQGRVSNQDVVRERPSDNKRQRGKPSVS